MKTIRKNVYMGKLRLYAIAFLIIMLYGCTRSDRETMREVESFYNSLITISTSQMQRFEGCQDSLPKNNAGRYRMIVYTDSTECSPCALKHLYSWEPILDSLFAYPLFSDVFFIFSPSNIDYSKVSVELRNTSFKYPVYLDSCNAFSKDNRNIPTNRMMHTFLIDEDGHVVLVGNPLTNEKIRALYFDVLNGEK